MTPCTVFLSRLIGLFALILSLSLLADKEASVSAIVALVHERPLLLIIGMMGLLAGLAIVLTHNVWTGGAVPILITLIGWWILIRGMLLILLPAGEAVRLFDVLRYEELFYLYTGVTLIIGVFLTYRGFTTTVPFYAQQKAVH
jgi:hypothetical protein